MILTHESIPPFIYDGAKVLILGSFPSVKSREEGFYYSNKSNRFYKVLARIFNEKVPLTLDEKKEFLTKKKIALYDVVYSCEIEGSKDEKIKVVKCADIKNLVDQYNIRKVFTTGKKAGELYSQYIKDDALNLPSTSARNASYNLEKLIISYSCLLSYLID